MKKLLVLLSFALTIGGWVFFTTKQENNGVDKTPKAGPGYFDFLREIKGEPPYNAINIWAKQIRFAKGGEEILDSLIEMGPTNIGGRTRALIVDSRNKDRMLVGAISGGMWVTETSGTVWTKLNDRQITLNVSHLTQNPLNPSVLYYCTGEGAGNSSGAPGAGIFKSTNGGQSFFQIPATANGDFDYGWRVVCSPIDTHTLFVATNTRGMFRSKDGGQSFEKVVYSARQINDVEIFPDGLIMISIRGQGIYTSPTGDNGSWTLLSTGLPNYSNTGRMEMAYCANQPNEVYVAISNLNNNGLLGVWRSRNRGLTWAQTAKNPASEGGQFPFTWYCLALHVKRDDPNTIILGSVNLIYSRNGGAAWSTASNSHADYHVMADHPDKPDKLYIGNDGGVYEYTWSALNGYKNLNNDLNITQFYTGAVGPNGIKIIGGTQDNGTNFSLNGSDTFIRAYGGDGSYTQISQQNESTGYLSFQNGRIFRVDGFGTYDLNTTDILGEMDLDGDKVVDDGAWFIHPFDINPQDGEMVFYPTKKKVYRSVIGGIIFDPITADISVGSNQQPFCIGVSNQLNPTIYIGGSNSLFHRVSNAGTVKGGGKEVDLRLFTPMEVRNSFMGCIKVNPVDASTLFVSYLDYNSAPRVYKVLKANSDTPVFVNISGNLPVGMPVNWVEVDPASGDSVIFAGTDRGLFYTVDGGANWVQDERIPNVVVDMLRLRMSDRRLFIYTHGRGVFSGRILPYNKAIPPHNTLGIKAVDMQGIRLMPNPANSEVKIAWHEGLGNKNEVIVFDAAGRSVKQSLHENGSVLNVSDLQNGIYYIRIKGAGTKKMLIKHD